MSLKKALLYRYECWKVFGTDIKYVRLDNKVLIKKINIHALVLGKYRKKLISSKIVL